MKNKVALITGAGGGIGKAIAVRLAKSGVRLALCGRSTAKLQDTREAVLPYTEEPLLLAGDLTEDAYLFSLAEKTAAHFGALDILINNAGMAYNGPFAETSTETFDALMKINARCPYFLSQSALPYLKSPTPPPSSTFPPPWATLPMVTRAPILRPSMHCTG
ncbi:MAG: SDR family NAD(P)-dependent oxidoreductase [Clostridia bacterium]|nr:SDR family NAD(P)-dependent oxidoreductase [Clostridia bacterium]